MSNPDFKNLGYSVTTREVSWLDLCMRAWGAEFNAPDHNIYQFSKGRMFDSSDRGLTGIYGVRGDTVLVFDGQQYPDMRDGLILGVGVQPGSANYGFGSYQEVDAE